MADPLPAGHELRYHPGATNLRMADVVVVNKVDSADPDAVTTEVLAPQVAGPPAGGRRRRVRLVSSGSVMSRVTDHLTEHNVAFQVLPHRRVFTSVREPTAGSGEFVGPTWPPG